MNMATTYTGRLGLFVRGGMAGAVLLVLVGCQSVVNEPVKNFPMAQIEGGDASNPVTVAVRTTFAAGARTMHVQRAPGISNRVASSLNAQAGSRVSFQAVGPFDDVLPTRYDYVLELFCEEPVHETKRNNALLMLGWPATISLFAAPLGLAVLSYPKLETDQMEFHWQVRLLRAVNDREFREVSSQALEPLVAAATGSAWGISEETCIKAGANADTHVIASAIEFASRTTWQDAAIVASSSGGESVGVGGSGGGGVVAAVATGKLSAREIRTIPPLSVQEIGRLREREQWKALLIGISDYRDNNFVNDLSTPSKDVSDLAKALREDFGFTDVRALIDDQATRQGILAAFDSLYEDCTQDDNVLVYYAGHGDLNVDKSGFWLPQDASDKYSTINNSELKDRVVRLRARRVLLVSDSCFAGSFLHRAMGVAKVPEVKTDVIKRITDETIGNKAGSREAMTSGAMAPVSDEGVGFYAGHSPFSGALLTALDSVRPGAAVNVADVFEEVSRQVKEQTKGTQTPQFAYFAEGHGGGSFYFLRSP